MEQIFSTELYPYYIKKLFTKANQGKKISAFKETRVHVDSWKRFYSATPRVGENFSENGEKNNPVFLKQKQKAKSGMHVLVLLKHIPLGPWKLFAPETPWNRGIT